MPSVSENSISWLSAARKILRVPDLELVLKQDWGSARDDFRTSIRRALIEKFAVVEPELIAQLLELGRLPVLPRHLISISHGQLLGGFASAQKFEDRALGFDLELEARIQIPIVERVSSREELSQAPFPQALWGAKEAAFKALDRKRGLIISQLIIQNWKSVEGCWSFTANFGSEAASGVLKREGPWLFALAVTN
jgi:hypothetical protein